jgi:hypothetical protein
MRSREALPLCLSRRAEARRAAAQHGARSGRARQQRRCQWQALAAAAQRGRAKNACAGTCTVSKQRFSHQLARAAASRDGPRGAAPAGGAAWPHAWLRGGGASARGVCCVDRVCTPSCLRAYSSSVPPTPDARFLRWRVSRVRARARRRRARPSSWRACRQARRWASSLRCPKATASRCRRSCPASSTSTGARCSVPRGASLQQRRALPRGRAPCAWRAFRLGGARSACVSLSLAHAARRRRA